ncbi:CobW-like GTP-binding protein [Pseudomonas sp. 148P]|uniref:CobW-like GTP-binding protein n=1 Tax=Pseudomonas ulcerans TaxID=3115852 RepID=A0ABU7HK59_9PSED|nr:MULTISPECIES: CobW-like GTP-binding protein [unclassified Pseudomonas]MEE1922255.1 CobW-like GTP-binding protein [Pseudomonas sp. 147P]MEE1931900.1 CobW-like GTP-binding protein [Pseudomonas sp. 148P]
MLQNIPTHLIAGPLGAGKTSLIRHLLGQRPSNERWAVLINEFGQIGLDAALLNTDDDGVSMGEVAGGCLCCVNGAPFQVGLGRLLRRARPDRLFIEPSGLGHPAELLAQLRLPPWRGVLAVQPSVMVLDAQALASGAVLPQAQAQALASAGLLVLNKAGIVDERQRLWISSRLPPAALRWVDHGGIELADLPKAAEEQVDNSPVDNVIPDGKAQVAALWTDPTRPLCSYQQAADGWSIGWRFHPQQRLDLARLQVLIEGLEWQRAKMVVHGAQGWRSANALDGQALAWEESAWRKDSRIELIFSGPQDHAALERAMLDCRLPVDH